jgi:hypothetical protein
VSSMYCHCSRNRGWRDVDERTHHPDRKKFLSKFEIGEITEVRGKGDWRS